MLAPHSVDVSEVVGLVLAAGASRRMGAERNKLLEDVGGRPLVCRPIDALRAAGVARIVVVLGYEADAVRAAIGPGVELVAHPDWAQGMGSSIACGVRHVVAERPPAAVLVCVGDLPGLRVEHVRPLLERFAEDHDPACICLPTHAGRDGHPVLFGSGHLASLAALSGDRGGRALVETNPDAVRRIEVETSAVLRDVDTPADLDAVRD